MKRRKNPKRYQRWSQDELREVETLVASSYKTLGMALALGRSINAIKHVMLRYKNGLRVERQALTLHGHRAIAQAFGVGERTAYRWICMEWIDGTYDKIERFIRNPKYWPFWEIARMGDVDLQAIARRYRGDNMPWLLTEQAMQVYGVSRRHLQRMAKDGLIDAEYLPNGKWVIKNLEG